MTAPVLHGGDLAGVARRYGGTAADYLDFSANINPAGPPAAVRAYLGEYAAGRALLAYPEPELPELAAAFAAACGVGAANVVIHAGSAALFDTVVRALRPRKIGLCVPAFAEYARAAALNGAAVATFALDPFGDPPLDPERFARWVRETRLDLVILTNPHNPLGFAFDAATMDGLIAACRPAVCAIDEAFADYVEGVSVVRRAAADPRVVVVRSVTKFFAIPDLRVGYAVATPEHARALRAFIPAWPVSGPAAGAARIALDDRAFADAARRTNARERETLAAGLTGLGLRVLPGSANFLCFAASGATTLRERLIVEHRIVVRDCSSFGGLAPARFVRVAVRSPGENARLLAALGAVL